MSNEDQNGKEQKTAGADQEAPKTVAPWSTPVPEQDSSPTDITPPVATHAGPEEEDADMPRPIEAWEEVLASSSTQDVGSDTDDVSQEETDSFPPEIPEWEIPGTPSES